MVPIYVDKKLPILLLFDDRGIHWCAKMFTLAQAENLNRYVGDLVAIVGSKRSAQTNNPSGQTSVQETKRITNHKYEPTSSITQGKEPKPDELIPFEDDDFQDF